MTEPRIDYDPLAEAIRSAFAAAEPAMAALEELSAEAPFTMRAMTTRVQRAAVAGDLFHASLRHDLRTLIDAVDVQVARGRHTEILYDPYYVGEYYEQEVLEPSAAALLRALTPVTQLLSRLDAVDHIKRADVLAHWPAA
ncbi:hypothetical protein [Roseivivax marinus]|uniref:hypothetical protein n=1 Tax=Roseivivax marinus TaxID=1379903 RepID=UPI00273F3D08|nr:hypothetical protein [Roseivivax marinus]